MANILQGLISKASLAQALKEVGFSRYTQLVPVFNVLKEQVNTVSLSIQELAGIRLTLPGLLWEHYRIHAWVSTCHNAFTIK